MPFDTAVGDTPIVKAYVGTTPVIRTYVGDKHVWPPFSATVTYVGSQVFTGTASATFPVHTPNDLLVIYAVGGGAPVAPAGWIDVPTGQSGNPAGTLAYKWATGTTANTGVWNGNAAGIMYVFRDVNKTTPFGAVGTSLGNGLVATAPAITLTEPNGSSLVAHQYFNNGTTGAWTNKAPTNFIIKNLNARMASTLAVDTASTVVGESSLTHSSSQAWRSLAFEVLAEAVSPGLYDVEIEYLPAYEVRFTALTDYAESANDAFFFRCSNETGLDGYVGRTFTKKFSGTAPKTCTLQDYYGGGAGGTMNTITFSVSPKSTVADALDGVTADAPAGAIKGNADSGLYHMPGDPHYDETIAEATFTTEAEAKAAGFIKYTKRRKKT